MFHQLYIPAGTVDTLSQTVIGIRELPPPPIPQIINITNVFQTINVTKETLLLNHLQLMKLVFRNICRYLYEEKDVKENLIVQIRTMELGTPTLIQVQFCKCNS